MGALDRLMARLGYVKPQRRSFAAAGGGNLVGNWSTADLHINQSLYRSLRTLRARSRDLARNNDYARQFLRMVRTNVVGPSGFGLQVHARMVDGRLDDAGSSRCEAAFAKWSRREHCDHVGRLSWTEFQQLWIETIARDGEVLVRRIRGHGEFGYRLQLIDPALLDETHNDDLPGGARIRMGVEIDRDGRPLAYHLLTSDSADPRRVSANTRQYVRVLAADIWHDYLVEQAGQLRGVPWMSSTLIRQKRLGSFEDAAVAAAEEGAKKLAWLKTPHGDLAPLADNGGDQQPTTGTLYSESGDGVHYAGLPPGYELQAWDPKYPDQSFGDFVKATLRGIAAGLGVAYHNLANDLEGVNYSSSRAGILEEREVWKTLQVWMIDRLCARVYSEWLPFAILSGQIETSIDLVHKWDHAVWQGRRWTWVDPLKDVNASILAIQNGLTSRTRVIRDMGHDPEEIWAELERERVHLATVLAQAPQAVAEDDDDE